MTAPWIFTLFLAMLPRTEGSAAQSLWYGEGLDVALARQSWQRIVPGELSLPVAWRMPRQKEPDAR